MKKIISITFISLLMTSLTSCFLFQTHETCPAYSQNENKVNKQEIVDDVIEIENSNV